MKPKSFCKIVTLILFILILLLSLEAFAAEKRMVTPEGILMEIDLQKNMMVVNERTFIWDKKTTFLNESGAPLKPELLKVGQKVYIEGERLGRRKGTLIKEIRLLPK